VSKDRLDVMVLPEQESFSVRNDAAGWAELVARASVGLICLSRSAHLPASL
jgi:hypothetical protein